MTDRQFEMLLKVLGAIAEDVHWIASEGIPSGSFTASGMTEFLKNVERIATTLENADWAEHEE